MTYLTKLDGNWNQKGILKPKFKKKEARIGMLVFKFMKTSVLHVVEREQILFFYFVKIITKYLKKIFYLFNFIYFFFQFCFS